ncbi:MAG: PAS domain-containing sensor histidine kinase, partial [Deltaproteobacteria bacterium]|nr:PAS domain-containing sensor histidine kinase [Deltaproteobacteria bacterium]
MARALHRLHHDARVLLLALFMAVPGAAIALRLGWMHLPSQALRWTLTAAVLGALLIGGLLLRAQIVRPLQLLTNLLAAVREGDLSLRVGEASREDPLGAALLEAGAIADTLREQRLDSLEAAGLLGAVMTEIEVAVFAFDGETPEARLLLVNRAGTQLLGKPEERLKGCTAQELGLAEALSCQGPRTLTLSLGGAESGRWEARTRPFRQGGKPHRVLVLSDLRRALREEERQAWQRLVRVLSHEINNSLTPIQSISASLRAIVDKSADDTLPADDREDLRAGLSVIGGRSEAVARFMAAYAKLARLPQPTRRPLELTTWVRRVAALEQRASVIVEPGPPMTIEADGDQLDQLLINLVSNAVEASLPAKLPVRITWNVIDRALEVRVLDAGPGLPPSANLFVPFFTTKQGGSGIGLVLSRQIAEAHG